MRDRLFTEWTTVSSGGRELRRNGFHSQAKKTHHLVVQNIEKLPYEEEKSDIKRRIHEWVTLEMVEKDNRTQKPAAIAYATTEKWLLGAVINQT